MLHANFVELDAYGQVYPAEVFDKYYAMNEWSLLPVPRLAFKLRAQSNSRFLWQILMKDKQ